MTWGHRCSASSRRRYISDCRSSVSRERSTARSRAGSPGASGDVAVHEHEGRELITRGGRRDDGAHGDSARAHAGAPARVRARRRRRSAAVARRRRSEHRISPHFRKARADRRGLRRIKWVRARATARSESVGESVSRAVIEWLGYEEPELQVVFEDEGVDGSGRLLLATDADHRRIGWLRQVRRGGRRGLQGSLHAEKIREDRLRRQVGRLRAMGLGATRCGLIPMDAKLRAAGLTPIRPRNVRSWRPSCSNPRSTRADPAAHETRLSARNATTRGRGFGRSPAVSWRRGG